MAEINDLTIVDASNTARFPESMAPSAVNNGARALEGLVARWHRDINTSVLTTGTSTAYVYAANQTLSAYYDGLMLGVDFHTACGATPTINVDALGAKSLKWPNGTALASGDVATGQKALIVYDGTDMIVLSSGGALSSKDTVATAYIDDNAVTLAKVAHATQGEIPYYGASGAPAALSVGTSGQFLQTQGAGANPQWASVVGVFGNAMIHVRDEKTAGTDGGTFTSGAWRTRTLNTAATNEISGASLASNQITLPAGTYMVMAHAPAFQVAAHKAKLYDITGAADLVMGTAAGQNSASGGVNESFVNGRFTLAGTSAVELQHQCGSTNTTDGFGAAAGFSATEVYSEVMIWKVG